MINNGIYIPDPPPSAMGEVDDHPDMSHLSDEELLKMSPVPIGGDHPDMSHLSDAELMRMGKKEEKSASADELGKAFTGPINKLLFSPVEAAGWLANKGLAAAGKEPLDVHGTLQKYFYPDVPDTSGTRIMGAAGQALGDTGMLMASAGESAAPMMYRAAAPAIARAQEGIGPVTRALQDTYKSYIANPKMLTRDVFFGAPAAGAGQEIAHQATKDSPLQPVADAVGAITGNMIGSNAHAIAGALPSPIQSAKWYLNSPLPTPTLMRATGIPTAARELYGKGLNMIPNTMTEGDGAIARALRNMKDSNQAAVNKSAMPVAANVLQDIISQPAAQQNYGLSQKLRDAISGFNPTLAESIGAPSLMKTQQSMESKASGSVLDNFIQRKQGSQDAIQNFAEANAPAAASSDLTGPVERRVQQAAGPVDNQLGKVQTGRETLANSLPEAQQHQVGATMRDQLEGMRATKMEEMGKLSDDMGLNDAKNLRVSREGIQKAVTSALPSRFAANTSPTLKTIGRLDQGEALSFKDAQYFMSNLKAEARQAAKNGNQWDAKILTDASGNIDGYLKNEWAPALGIGDKYAAYRDRYLNEYIKPFEQGAAKDVTSLGGDTRYRTDNEDVAGKFWQPGNITAAQDFHKTFQGNDKALDAMQGYILDDVRSVAVKDGVLDPKKMDKWMQANKDNLSQFPSIEKRLKDTQSMATDLAQRQATLEGRRQTVEDSDLAQMLSKKNVTMDGLLKDKNSFGRVVQNATPAEKQALARQMWDRASTGGETDPASMKKFLTDNADALPKVLGKDHIENLHNLADAWEMNARSMMPTGSPVDQNPFAAFTSKFGSSPQQLLSRAFAVKSGRTGIKYTAGDLLARVGLNASRRQANELIGRSIYDPAFAKDLTDFVASDKLKPEKLKRIKAYMFNSGISAMSEDEGEDDDQ